MCCDSGDEELFSKAYNLLKEEEASNQNKKTNELFLYANESDIEALKKIEPKLNNWTFSQALQKITLELSKQKAPYQTAAAPSYAPENYYSYITPVGQFNPRNFFNQPPSIAAPMPMPQMQQSWNTFMPQALPNYQNQGAGGQHLPNLSNFPIRPTPGNFAPQGQNMFNPNPQNNFPFPPTNQNYQGPNNNWRHY